MHRARAALRGGRLAVHAHGRQHARDLRLREGAAPRRAARRGGGREPRPRDLRPRLRAHRRFRARPREPRALGRAGPRVRSRRGGAGAAHARATTSRSPRPTTSGAGAAYDEALELALRPATCPRRSRSTPRSRRSPPIGGDWPAAEAETEASLSLAEREGLVGKLCFPYAMRGLILWREGELDEAAEILRRAVEIAEQVGPPRSRSSRCRPGDGAPRPRGPRRRRPGPRRALDLCERAGLVAQSVEATAARAVNLASLGARPRPARRGRRRGRPGWPERLRYPDRPAPPASRPAARGGRPADAARRELPARRLLGGTREAREALEPAAREADRHGATTRRAAGNPA